MKMLNGVAFSSCVTFRREKKQLCFLPKLYHHTAFWFQKEPWQLKQAQLQSESFWPYLRRVRKEEKTRRPVSTEGRRELC